MDAPRRDRVNRAGRLGVERVWRLKMTRHQGLFARQRRPGIPAPPSRRPMLSQRHLQRPLPRVALCAFATPPLCWDDRHTACTLTGTVTIPSPLRSCSRYGCEWLHTAVKARNSEAQVQICNTTSPLLPGSDLLHARRHGSDSGRLGSACRGMVHTDHKISRDLRAEGCRQNKSGYIDSYTLGGLGGTYQLRTGGTG